MFDRVTDSYEFPADLPDDPDAGEGALGWTSGVIALATLLLALTNAAALRGWSEDLPPGPGVVRLVGAAGAWEEATARAGLGAGHARLHKAWKRMESASWTPRAAPIEQAQR